MHHQIWVFLVLAVISSANAATAEAIFAGGSFFSMQADFDKLPGVLTTLVGYDGGHSDDPSYRAVFNGKNDYTEAVKITYDPNKISYQQLLHYFWIHVDPTDDQGQFCHRGNQFKSAIFYLNREQQQLALASQAKIFDYLPAVRTVVIPTTQFYAAEDNYQKYYQKHALRYRFERWHCNRDFKIKSVWRHLLF